MRRSILLTDVDRQPLISQCWYWFKRNDKRSGQSMHEMLLDDIEVEH